MPAVEFPDVAAFVTRRVGKDGRISGLGEYAGTDVYVVVSASKPRPKGTSQKLQRTSKGRTGGASG